MDRSIPTREAALPREPAAGPRDRSEGLASTTAFRPWRLVAAVLLALLAISAAVRWYAREVSVPRYCAEPEHSVELLARILTETRPAGESPRRPYIVAAKLLFLVPRGPDEAIEPYLMRVRQHLRASCR